jgi:hypothetical protein
MSNHCEKWKSDFRDDAFKDKHKSPLLSERFKSHLQLPSIRHSPNQQRITNPTTNPNPTKTKGKEKMGGSYLLCIYHASRFVIAQYGSHHSYPSGAGLSIMEWISPAFIAGLRRTAAWGSSRTSFAPTISLSILLRWISRTMEVLRVDLCD